LPFNIRNQNCDIWIRYGTPAYRMKVNSKNLPKIGCHANVAWVIKKEVQIDHLWINTYHLVKKSRENRSSGSWDYWSPKNRLKKIEINASKIYSPVGKFAKQAKNASARWSRHWQGRITIEDGKVLWVLRRKLKSFYTKVNCHTADCKLSPVQCLTAQAAFYEIH